MQAFAADRALALVLCRLRDHRASKPSAHTLGLGPLAVLGAARACAEVQICQRHSCTSKEVSLENFSLAVSSPASTLRSRSRLWSCAERQ